MKKEKDKAVVFVHFERSGQFGHLVCRVGREPRPGDGHAGPFSPEFVGGLRVRDLVLWSQIDDHADVYAIELQIRGSFSLDERDLEGSLVAIRTIRKKLAAMTTTLGEARTWTEHAMRFGAALDASFLIRDPRDGASEDALRRGESARYRLQRLEEHVVAQFKPASEAA